MPNREDIADAIAGSFADGPASKSRLIDTAERSLARQPVMRALHGLPDITYASSRDLWDHLPSGPRTPRSGN